MQKTIVKDNKYSLSQSDSGHPVFGPINVFDRFLALENASVQKSLNISRNFVKVQRAKTGSIGYLDIDLLWEVNHANQQRNSA